MTTLQTAAIAISLIASVVGVTLFVRTVLHILRVIKLGQPDGNRTNEPLTRAVTLVREFLGHTRMLRLKAVGVAHWAVMVSFGILFFTLVTAYGQLFDPHFVLPIIGHFPPVEWAFELFGWACLIGISVLMLIRQKNHPRSAARDGKDSRFYGSGLWKAYYVELTILGVAICVVLLRALESQLVEDGTLLHFPLSLWLGKLAFGGMSVTALENTIVIVAMVKILISMAWFITVALQPTMGVAWHRFLAFFNIFFKRHAAGRTSLGALQPMMVGGKALDFENLDDLDEDAAMGVGKVEDFTWKGLLDFSTCTECGRCQSQCPAWNTDKPLSPKLLMMGLRDHAYAKSEALLTPEDARESLHADVLGTLEQSLIGDVIDPDVLWSCVTCGACVEQCPVDIEHVDHIVDMRRYQVLIESAFPNELNNLYKNLEKSGNPWGASPRERLGWAKDLPFEVKQFGVDVESLDEVEYLFWVGCAGAYEDRAKKTTQAVAELLHNAGVDFAVLGDGETCTGDSARRSGNEFLFQQLAMQNVEVLNEAGAKKIVATCAHCFNTLSNEYPQLGGNYEVVHHTQLLNRLVREKKLVPVAAPAGEAAGSGKTVTYHDPCYIGRHNGVYTPPRELIGAVPGVELKEMPRNQEKSFCCGAGGARMWQEENLGSRINMNRTNEAVATGADQIAVGCPFCRVMLSDGLTAAQGAGDAREEVEVLDVAQMLLAAVKRG